MTDDNQQTSVDSNNFTALAQGVFDNAPDVTTGRAALLQAYGSYNWSDPQKAQATLEDYGQALKFAHKDVSQMDGDTLEKTAPVPLSAIPLAGLKNDQELYSKWKDANLSYLKDTTDPQFVVQRPQMQNDIAAHADSQIQAANATNIQENVGPAAAKALDLNTRFAKAAIAPASAVINAASFGHIDPDSYLTQTLDANANNDVSSKAASLAGGISGMLATGGVGAAGPALVTGGLLAQGAQSIYNADQTTFKNTGDTGAAREAAGIEAGSQALQIAGGSLVFGSLAKQIIGQTVTAEGKSLLQEAVDAGTQDLTPAVQKYLNTPVTSALQKGAIDTTIQAATQGSAQVGNNAVSNLEQNKPVGQNLSSGVGENALMGGIGAAGAEAVVHFSNGAPAISGDTGGTSGTDGTQPPAAQAAPADNTGLPPNTTVSKANTTVRAGEIAETGRAITPVTTQVLGGQQPGVDNTDFLPGEDDTSYTPQTENLVRSADPITDPAYTLKNKSADGSEYTYSVKDNSGLDTLSPDAQKVVTDVQGRTQDTTDPTYVPKSNTEVVGSLIQHLKSRQEELNQRQDDIANSTDDVTPEIEAEYNQNEIELDSLNKQLSDHTEAHDFLSSKKTPVPPTESSIDDAIPASQPAYTTADGANHSLTEDGHFVQDGELPHDKTIFMDDSTTDKVKQAVSNGEHITMNTDGTPVIEHVADDGTLSYEAIPGSTDPMEGTTPLSVSAERMISKQKKTRPAKIGEKITKVNPDLDRSVGAAGPAALGESTYAKSLSNDESLPESTRKIGGKIPGYLKFTDEGNKTAGTAYVNDEGIDKAANDLYDPNIDPVLKGGIATAIHNYYTKAIKQATLDGDPDALETAEKGLARHAAAIADHTSLSGQVLRANAGKDFEGLAISKKYNDTYQTEINSAAAKAGLNPEDIHKSEDDLARVNEKLNALQPTADANEKDQTDLQNTNNQLENAKKTQAGQKQAPSELKALKDQLKNASDAVDQQASNPDQSPENKQKLDNAKKQLKDLTAKKQSLEDTLSKTQETQSELDTLTKQHKKISENLSNRGDVTDKINELKAQRDSLKQKTDIRQKARQKAIKAAAVESENQTQIRNARELLRDPKTDRTAKDLIRDNLSVRENLDETNPSVRIDGARFWSTNVVGGLFGSVIANIHGLALAPGFNSLKLTGSSLKALFQNIARGSLTDYKYPLLGYLRGLTSGDAYTKGAKTALIALLHGDRLENNIPREELAGRNANVQQIQKLRDRLLNETLSKEQSRSLNSELKRREAVEKGVRSYDQTIADYQNYAKSLKFDPLKSPAAALRNIGVAAAKMTGWSSGSMLRVMAATHAMTYAIHDAGFDRAAAAIEYNKAKSQGVSDAELEQYQYSPKENWEKAGLLAKAQSDKLRAAGIEVSPDKEYLSQIGQYEAMRPRAVQVSAYKRAAAVGLRGPAPGYIGMVSHGIESALNYLEPIPILNKLKYLVPFSNIIAVHMGDAVEFTPFSLLGLINNEAANRTNLDRSMMISGAATGTMIASSLALYAIKQLNLPEKDRNFDLIGNYSSNPQKRAEYVQNGGKLYSLRFGNTHLDFGESAFALVLGGAAAAVDRVRDGKDPDPESATNMMTSGFHMVASMAGALGSMSMLRGITDIASGVKDALDEKTGADIKLTRTLMTTMKGFVPGNGILKSIARYTDNPVDANKDFKSAIFSGIPGLQTAFGKPALNVMGEPLPSDASLGTAHLHRVYSSKGSDLDLNWLSESGYSVPGISHMPFSKDMKAYAGKYKQDQEFNYNLKYNAYTAAAPELRSLVSRYRARYGVSAPSVAVQKGLNSDWSAILAKHTWSILKNNN